MSFSLVINGTTYEVKSDLNPVTSSLNTFIRDTAQLKGTKFMCREGGCGVCVVNVKDFNSNTNEMESKSVNSCLFPLYRCIGSEITTIEGLGSVRGGLHPIQERLQHFHGTQCGYCSPGMVMTMHGLMESKNGSVSMAEIEDSLSGNHCRCTGYRPILDAFKSLATDAAGKYDEMCKNIEDIEDFVHICPSPVQQFKNIGEKNLSKIVNSVVYTNDDRKWCIVYSVKEVFDKLKEIGNNSYMLIAGNTAHGVYRRNPDIILFINITRINKLRSYSIGNQIELGGCVTLSEMIEILRIAASSNRLFDYCNQIVSHLELVANVHIRNTGTIAGNLVIKHQHNKFSSDLFLIFMACGAMVTITDSTLIGKQYSMENFLRTSMKEKLILRVTLPALDPNEYIFRSYKVRRRAQNAHADVNAAFLGQYKNQLIESIRICYGGISKNFIHAANTEKLLFDKDLYDDEVLQAALHSLNSEINPTWIEPQTSVEHRKGVAIALFYKFVLNTCPASRMKPEYMTGGQLLKRPLSSGQQSFETVEKNWPLTKPIPKVEAQYQCTGEAEYVNDMPNLPRQLFVALVVATKVGYTIAQIDATEALVIPGVLAFYSAKDIPGENNFADPNLFLLGDSEEIFCSGVVQYHSQPAGMILADTFEKAHYAVAKVKLIYDKNNELKNPIIEFASSLLTALTGRKSETIQVKPIVDDSFYISQEIKDDMNHKNEMNYLDKTIKYYFHMNGQYHYTMETLSTICVPSDQGLKVYCSSNWPDAIQIAVAKAINEPECSITVYIQPVGGSYGMKVSRSNFSAAVCAIATVLTNRPVRFVMTIEENMATMGKRCACYSDYDVTFKANGKIVKVDNRYVIDSGCNRNENSNVFIGGFYGNCYDRSIWKPNGEVAVTQSASNTWCRAPGGLEGIAMPENIMEHVAWTLKRDPVDIRLVNIPQDNVLKQLIPQFLQNVDYRNRRAAIDEFNSKNRWIKRGLGLCPMQYQLEVPHFRTAQVNIYHADGSVIVIHGAVEIGQGVNTKVAQVAAHTLGIPIEQVKVKRIDSNNIPNCPETAGSFGTDTAVFATLKACDILNHRLQPVKDKMPKATFFEITREANIRQIDLSARYTAVQKEFTSYNIYGVSCAEVEVDVLTGMYQINRVDILEDTGESLNPALDIGQVEGAYVMGLGYWLTEELKYDRTTGELLTKRTWDYKVPGAKDIPIDFRVHLLQKTPNPLFVLKSKAVGEPPICMAINSIFALRHALNSARKDAGEENWYHLGAPTTNETIFLSAKNKLVDYKLLS